MVNITRLREVNDSLGQGAGNELIREVGRRIRERVKQEDTVARVSGGEFSVLAEALDSSDEAWSMGMRILESASRGLELSGRSVYPGVSIGFTLFPSMGSDSDTLLKQADMAETEAKQSTLSIQEFVGQEDWISQKFHLEQDLKNALAQEEFFLCYQPQMDLRTGDVVGMEALLRWHHPERGVVSPGEFIPLLEHTGLIVPVDEWVVHSVCEQLKSWQEKHGSVRAGINLSAQDLNGGNIVEAFRKALEGNGLDARNIIVEITETCLMQNMDRASGILQTFSEWGMQIALDDFGKGYSCMSYLQQLGIHVIKIDKEFVSGLPEKKDSVNLVQTIISMAHNMGKLVLAEGVEREEQRQMLRDMGCDYGQGFLWGYPEPADTVFNMIYGT
jgi:diguanylate cyclase (GGDEF)-like protein